VNSLLQEEEIMEVNKRKKKVEAFILGMEVEQE